MAPPQRSQLRQPAAVDLTIWQCTIPTLSQRLGSFPSESRVEIFLYCRKYCLLPPPINIGGFDGPREDKIGSKNQKKPASSPIFFCSKSLSTLSLHRALSDSKPRCHQLVFNPPQQNYPTPPKAPPFSSTATAANQHHHFHFLPSPVSAAAAPTPPRTPPPASGRLPKPLLTPRQASDNNFFSSARLPLTLLRHLQLWSCMQNVNLLFTFCN